MNENFELENMRQQLHHGRLPADDPLQLLGIREVERLLHSFLDFHLHHHAG